MDAVAADFVITMTGEVMAPGWVAFEDGVIVEVAQGEPPRDLDARHARGRHALLPGLVSPHCHLPLGTLRGIAPDSGFFDWIHKGVLPGIEGLTRRPERFLEGARLSAAELLRGGVTLVGDAFLRAEGVTACREKGLCGVYFQEVFGSFADDEDAYIAETATALGALPGRLSGFPFGYSPHTPWTCPAKTLEAVVERARREGRRLSIHLDESEEEHLFFTQERGPIHEGWKRRGILDRFRLGRTPTACLSELGALGPDVVAVHCVQVTDDDIALLAESGTHVVHCPVSNMALAEGIAPVLPMLEAGVDVSLGTDSSASAGRLDMFEQMRSFLLTQRARYRRVGPLVAEKALRMATIAGAEALGLGGRKGTLEQGKDADIVLLDLEAAGRRALRDPLEAVVSLAGPAAVAAVWVEGALRHARAEAL